MLRTRWAAVAVVVTALVTPAVAEDQSSQTFSRKPVVGLGTTHVMVPTPPEQFTAHEPQISPYLFLNRCTGGCVITLGNLNDARTNTSTIPCQSGTGCTSTYTISEYRNANNETGALADAEWNAVVQCMREVYSPFAVNVVTERPTTGVSYTMGIVAGNSSEIAWPPAVFGVAPAACSPQDNVISFSFANQHGNTDRVNNICWTAAQETAHAFGLDHEYMFSDGTSACSDPMTYRTDCGGQKFFRNKSAQCGEESPRPCGCGGQQNSHVKLRNVFGDGQSLVPAPTCSIINPLGGSVTNSSAFAAESGSKRGVAKLELWINGFRWGEKPGALFGFQGQPNPSGYSFPLPSGIPDGNMDVQIKCFDDLGLGTDSQTVMVVKGAPCASADSCLKGQKCTSGYCRWDPPSGQLGDSCTYPQFCESMICAEAVNGEDFCSQECIVGGADACPMDYSCEAAEGATSGLCAPIDKGGCCSVGSDGRVAALMTLFVLGLVLRPRRRR